MKNNIKGVILLGIGAGIATAFSLHSAMLVTDKGPVFYSTHGVVTTPEALTDIATPTRSIATPTQKSDLPVVTVTATVPQQAFYTQPGITPEEARLRSIEARLSALEARK